MIEIQKVQTKKQMRQFVRFPNLVYRGNDNYVPPFEMDEMNITNPKKNASLEDCDIQCFLCLKDGKVSGRIMGIVSHLANKKNNEKSARFSRFECLNDQEVANALFEAAETWAKEKGMTKIHGPLGFNDLDRQGLVIEGFENPGTYQCSYNADYYQKLVENAGYVPDDGAKWFEWRLTVPSEIPERIDRVAEIVEKRYGFYEKRFKTKKEIIDIYGKEFFRLLDICFEKLYATIPFTEKLANQTIELFKLILDPDYITLIFDKENFIGFGLGYPSIARALAKSKGRVFPFGIFRLLHAIKKPKILELGLIAVLPEYQKKGVTALIIRNMLQRIIKNKIEFCDTGQQLENNAPIQTVFDAFDRKHMRTKLCYVKQLKAEKK